MQRPVNRPMPTLGQLFYELLAANDTTGYRPEWRTLSVAVQEAYEAAAQRGLAQHQARQTTDEDED